MIRQARTGVTPPLSGFKVRLQGPDDLVLTSALTGRQVMLNQSEKDFVVAANPNLPGITAALTLLLRKWRAKEYERSRPQPWMHNLLSEIAECSDVVALVAAVSAVLERSGEGDWGRQRRRLFEVLFLLWAHGALAFPKLYPFGSSFEYPTEPLAWGPLAAFSKTLDASLVGESRQTKIVIVRLIHRCRGFEDIGDLSPEICKILTEEVAQDRIGPIYVAIKVVRQFHLRLFGAAAENIAASSYGERGKKTVRLDKNFNWVVDTDPTMTSWRDAAAAYISGETRGHAGKLNASNAFLDFLIAHPGVARDPAQLVRGGALPESYSDWLLRERNLGPGSENHTRYVSVAHDLLESVILRRWTDDGIVAPGIRNPIKKETRKGASRVRTNRRALPFFIIRRMGDVIEADDFKWARTLDADYFTYLNSETGEFERRWSPVRAYAMLVKLHLPIRGFQLRMLNSGEADHIVFRPERGGWVLNEHVLAGPAGSKAVGVIRRFKDTNRKSDFPGFFINTNKTQDQRSADSGSGYEIPWNYEKVIGWLCAVRDFQERYNPISRKMSWVDLHEGYIRTTFSEEQLLARGAETFLFRDPSSENIHEPMGGSRIAVFWDLLCAEVESLLEQEGTTQPDGSRIELVKWSRAHERTPKLNPKALYDLHSLRVSVLTALAIEGGVPIPILARCVAGHSNILMTLYYQSISVGHVSDVLNEGQLKVVRGGQARLVAWLKEQDSAEKLAGRIVATGSGMDAVLRGEPGSWVVLDAGICPVGCSRCGDGGPKQRDSDRQEYARHKPVPADHHGNPRNCVRCRFFVTGPAFLLGLIAKFNATGLAVQSAALHYRERQDCLAELEAARNNALSGGPAFDRQRLLVATAEAVDSAAVALDQVCLSWHALFALVEQCREIMSRNAPEDRFALVALGSKADLETALEEVSDFEMVDYICQSAVWFQSINPELANLKRSRVLDAMLVRQDYQPVFSKLTEGECLKVGNELTRLLYACLGRTNLMRLMAGETVIEQAGVREQIDALLGEVSSRMISSPKLIEAHTSG